MDINRENYEQYFLDFTEGRLSPAMEKELSDFLLANPDLKVLLENYETTVIPEDEPVIFQQKEKLRKHCIVTAYINHKNAEEWMISSMEGLLKKEEELELEEFFELNPAYRYDREQYLKTRLNPDLATVFSHKNKLKRKVMLIPPNWLAWSAPAAAAVILMLLTIRFFSDDPAVIPEMKPPVVEMESHQLQIPSQDPIEPLQYANPAITALPKEAFSRLDETPTQPRENSFRLDARMNASVEVSVFMFPEHFPPEEKESAELFAFTPKEPSRIARVVSNYFGQAGRQIRENNILENIPNPRFDFWSVAQAGIKGYNSITDRDIELFVQKDEDGKMSSYALLEREKVILMKEPDRE